jgi:trk system potassium uptake protein TrkH
MKDKKIYISTQAYLIFTFLILIAIGTVLLLCPFVKHTNGINFIDALFTSTSAVCVTGLTVVDTSQFNLAGQFVILLLIQLGGIGIMTLGSSIILFLRGEIDLGTRIMASKINESYGFHEIEHILRFVLLYTFITEFIGILLLFPSFIKDGYEASQALYLAFFHSISAFCNAGFSTFDQSLMDANIFIKITIMLLIILGGLGYYVIFDITKRIKNKTRLKIHTKIVFIMTVFLILSGALAFKLIERNHISVMDSFFQSVTARTAGFNTIDLLSMHRVSLVVMILLMIIGASPGSTGGGLKTTTAFLTFVSIKAASSGATRTVVFGRKIPASNIARAFSIVILYFLVIGIASIIFLFFDDYNFLHVIFEVTSAVGTVGLSIGITSQADTIGKIILIICMFIGRLGPSAFLLAMIGREKPVKLDYPEEKIILG